MKRSYELVVYDPPRPQGRKRVRIRKGGVTLYPERKDDAARYAIRKTWMDAFGEEPLESDADFALSMIVFVPCPKGVSVKRRLQGVWPRGQRSGDVDNYLKAVLDALSGYAYRDDSQVQMLKPPFWKQYAYDPATGADTRPRLFIRLEEL